MSENPSDPVKFKQWADAACTSWPDDLTRKAYNKHKASENNPAFPPTCITDFDVAYVEYIARHRE